MVAIIANEPERGWLTAQLAEADERLISAPGALELGIVLEARKPDAVGIARRALRDAMISVVAFDEGLAARALDAWRRFGKGRHPAGLKFGDCCTYALAEQTDYPLLCLGDDFARTDLSVLQPPAH